jgi:hypothetical protein
VIGFLCATPMELARVLPLLTDTADTASPVGMRLIEGTAGEREILALSAGVGRCLPPRGPGCCLTVTSSRP